MPQDYKPTQIQSLLAGIVAGAVEGAVTYPAEFTKTKAQFSVTPGSKSNSITAILRDTIKRQGIKGLYSGSGALVTGNGLKAGVRFLCYDNFKELLSNGNTKITTTQSMLAGLGAGICEAVLVVTPSETIKSVVTVCFLTHTQLTPLCRLRTKLIEDAARIQSRYTNMANGTIGICRSEGLGGIYRGLFPTIMKQGVNSAVRFSSYSTLSQLAIDWTAPASGKLSSGATFGVGAVAGLITVYSTMPLDNIKTRMQGLEARSKYKNSFHCLQRIVTEEGVLRLWGGTTPRLVRLTLSGGIVFTVYEWMIKATTSL
ncbi:hypothetical protein QFC21_003022 [Naganishia friedmannii]|uniref:Uncharacterized protein n=1 Tax=Naganishia friedmannii TaxID=89922 RepID=A0ACC2VRQ7_9TREE|nr:hypothetical protein QFC21_003022 [Naganishia friedmannii]